ncbi:MAG: methionyl-tRNA formyltransferase, partial [Fimbriimonadaceae bacterium]|nr:methionyl-tRNA formyltransferase [Fimbriimonadaceae bacterium]
MRLVYMGSAGFAVPALEALADHVCLVVSQPDKPSGRKMELRPTPVKARALELGLPVETPRRCRSPKFIERIRALEADVLVVAAYGQILPAELLSAARQGAVNLHGSLLPRWRGAAPIQRSLAAGDMFTGVTLMQMDEGLDTGDIIAAESLAIGPHETAGEIFPRLAQTAADLAVAWMPQIAAGTHPRTPQDDEYATIAPKIGLDDARLSPEMDVRTAYNLF